MMPPGSPYDTRGKLHDWWHQQSIDSCVTKSQCIGDDFSKFGDTAPIFHGVAGCNKVTKFSRFIVHVQPDLKADTVSQAFNETLNSCFCRMRPRAQAEPDTQAEHDFKNMYIKVGGKNCVSEEAMETKLRSSGIEPLKVEGIMYKGSDEWDSQDVRWSQTRNFFKPDLRMKDDELLR